MANKRVTRYVVMASFFDCYPKPYGTFECKKLAQAKADVIRRQRGCDEAYVEPVRFRTPEVK